MRRKCCRAALQKDSAGGHETFTNYVLEANERRGVAIARDITTDERRYRALTQPRCDHLGPVW